MLQGVLPANSAEHTVISKVLPIRLRLQKNYSVPTQAPICLTSNALLAIYAESYLYASSIRWGSNCARWCS